MPPLCHFSDHPKKNIFVPNFRTEKNIIKKRMYVGRKRTYGGRTEERKRSETPYKRKTKQSKSRRARVARIDRPLGLSKKVTHRYVEQHLDLNPGLGGNPAEYFFSANGLYDPNITGVGHQPLGFDQIGVFFDHYTVIYSQINVWFNNLDSGRAQFVGIKMDDNSVVSGSIPDFVENGLVKWGYCNCTCSGGESTLLSMEMDVSKFMGRPSIMSEDELRGDTGSNPADQAYWHLMVAPNAADDANIVRCLVEITYVAVWTEPKDIPAS